MFSKLERKTVRHMMESVGLIALGYIIAVAGIVDRYRCIADAFTIYH